MPTNPADIVINMIQYPCPNCMEIKTTAGCGCDRRRWIASGKEDHYFAPNYDWIIKQFEDRIQKLEKEVQRLKEKE